MNQVFPFACIIQSTRQYEFWANVYKTWVVRGGIGFTLPAKSNRGRHSFNYNFAIGTYLTPHDQTPLGDLTVYLAADGFSTTDDPASDVDFLT